MTVPLASSGPGPTLSYEPLADDSSRDVSATPTAVRGPGPLVDEGTFPITFLDASHRRHTVHARRHWTVRQLKVAAADATRTSAESQRLIYMGSLLRDTDTIEGALKGLDGERIVHLFPRPQTASVPTPGEVETDRDGGGIPDQGSGGGRPMILPTPEIFQAQQRVRLLAFLLLFISSMQVLTLATILLGRPPADEYDSDAAAPPGDPTQISPEISVRSWKRGDAWNMALSLLGVYVGLVGIRSSTETSPGLSRRYLYGLAATGVIWIALLYHSEVVVILRHQGDGGEDVVGAGPRVYAQAALGCAFTVAVWGICWLRAWQYTRVLEEEERDLAGDDLDLEEEGVEVEGGNNNDGESVSFTQIV